MHSRRSSTFETVCDIACSPYHRLSFTLWFPHGLSLCYIVVVSVEPVWCGRNVLLVHAFCCCRWIWRGNMIFAQHILHIYSPPYARISKPIHKPSQAIAVRMVYGVRLQASVGSFDLKHGKCARSTSICQLYDGFVFFLFCVYAFFIYSPKWWFVFIHALVSFFRLVSASQFKLIQWFSI